jgi:uncharacterized protein (TIGR02466 family)
MQCDLLFPSPIFVVDYDIPDTNLMILDYIYYLEKSSEGVSKTNIGGWQSEDNFFESKNTQILVKNLENSISAIQEGLQITNSLYIDGAWANINRTGHFNARHVHPRSYLSGVYYVQASQNSGSIVFHSPVNCKEMIEPSYFELSTITANVMKYEPKVGRCIIFPSWLYHSVEPNFSSDDRISISFNIFYKE